MKKRYVKNGIPYFTPIVISKEVEYIDVDGVQKTKTIMQYTNDENEILAAGYQIYTPPKTSLSTLIKRSNERINREIDRKILNDFVWNENEFYLSMENQFNFKNLYDLREMKEYPITIKTKDGFTLLENQSEVTSFYLSGVTFIEECLKEGWQKKIDAEEEIRKTYE